MRRSLVFVSAVWLAGGCSGNISDSADKTTDPGQTGSPSSPGNMTGKPTGPGTTTPGDNKPPVVVGDPPVTEAGCARPGTLGTSPLRRLTHEEYNNTVKDLLGVDLKLADAFPRDGQVGGLGNNVAQQRLTGALVDQYFSAAEKISAKAVEAMPTLLGCDPAGANEQTCIASFIDATGLRAFRRPLSDEEKATFTKAFTGARTGADVKAGVRGVLEAMLVSPQFLFRTEGGTSSGGVDTLDGYSVASRLSYLLWATMPDKDLFAAAKAGALSTPAQIGAQFDRMIADPRSATAVKRLYAEWFETDGVLDMKKDATKFPTFSAKLAQSMKNELDGLIDYVFTQKGGSVEELMTTTESFVDADLAKLYGVTGVTGTAAKQVSLPADRRGGILSRAGVIASMSGELENKMVHRGFNMRERMLCQPVMPAPANIQAQHPPDPTATERQRSAKRLADGACMGCHSLMDPLGLALEKYDAMGVWRDQDGTATIDDSGELTATDKDGPFKGASGLGKALAANPTHQACVVQVFFRNAVGRVDESADRCALDALQKQFVAGGLRTKDLLKAIVTSDAFRFRPSL